MARVWNDTQSVGWKRDGMVPNMWAGNDNQFAGHEKKKKKSMTADVWELAGYRKITNLYDVAGLDHGVTFMGPDGLKE